MFYEFFRCFYSISRAFAKIDCFCLIFSHEKCDKFYVFDIRFGIDVAGFISIGSLVACFESSRMF